MAGEPELPWRVAGLPGASTSSGYTYNGGTWAGGGPVPDKSIAIRVWIGPYSEPATVQVDLGEKNHGCTVSLNPDLARQAAAALIAAADAADANIQGWRDVLERQRAELMALRERDMLGRAGLLDQPS